MSVKNTSASRRVELRKYPNRRYYDITNSRHVTLEHIYTMVREGFDVTVTDSKSGEDITTRVLAQIILEHDSPKLRMFPVDLLHQVIRANEPLIRDFVDKYFNQALAAFLQSQRHFERYLRQSLGLYSPAAGQQEFARMLMGPFFQPFASQAASEGLGNGEAAGGEGTSKDDELHARISQLEQQIDRLHERFRGQNDGQ